MDDTNVNDKLFEKARTLHDAQFKLGLVSLCKGKHGFADVFFLEAANRGNRRAQEYVSLLDNGAVSKSEWSRLVLDMEAKHILFGE